MSASTASTASAPTGCAPAQPQVQPPEVAVDCVRILAEAPSEAFRRFRRAARRLRKALAQGSAEEHQGAMEEAREALDSGLSALGGIGLRMARSLRTGSARW
jgi:hypothetical protein